MTQPVLWRPDLTPGEEDLLWFGGIGDFMKETGKPYYTVPALIEGIHRFNRATLEVCQAERVECVDLAAVIPRDTSMFYDDVHFSERGSGLVASTVVDYLKQRPPFVAEQTSAAH